jgi:hypothetical protein
VHAWLLEIARGELISKVKPRDGVRDIWNRSGLHLLKAKLVACAVLAALRARLHTPCDFVHNATGAALLPRSPMSDAGDSSRHSYSTGASGAGSSAASDTSDAAALNALADRG